MTIELRQPLQLALDNRRQLIREWLAKFALNADKELTPQTVAVYEALWLEGFSDLSNDVLVAAFRKTLQACKFWPVKVADVRERIEQMEVSAVNLQAEAKWQQVLSYALSTSPDYASRPVRFKEQTSAAIRAAGGLSWIRDCEQSELQWAKKRFVESFASWDLLKKNEDVLPPGELRNLIAEAAQKLLPEAKP